MRCNKVPPSRRMTQDGNRSGPLIRHVDLRRMRPRIRTLLAVLLCCAATSCGGDVGVPLRTTAQAEVVKALGSRIVELLARPDSVRSFLLSREQIPSNLGRPDGVAMWKVQRVRAPPRAHR